MTLEPTKPCLAVVYEVCFSLGTTKDGCVERNGDKKVNLRDRRALSGIHGRLYGLLKVYNLHASDHLGSWELGFSAEEAPVPMTGIARQ